MPNYSIEIQGYRFDADSGLMDVSIQDAPQTREMVERHITKSVTFKLISPAVHKWGVYSALKHYLCDVRFAKNIYSFKEYEYSSGVRPGWYPTGKTYQSSVQSSSYTVDGYEYRRDELVYAVGDLYSSMSRYSTPYVDGGYVTYRDHYGSRPVTTYDVLRESNSRTVIERGSFVRSSVSVNPDYHPRSGADENLEYWYEYESSDPIVLSNDEPMVVRQLLTLLGASPLDRTYYAYNIARNGDVVTVLGYNASSSEMFAYYTKMLQDLPEQFRGKNNIAILLSAFGRQLQELYQFFDDLNIGRWLDKIECFPEEDGTDIVKTNELLDRIGDIVCLTRAQAGLLTGKASVTNVLNDETYKKFLKYKILLNTSNSTYSDLIEGLRYFFPDGGMGAIAYEESPDLPARFRLRCDYPTAEQLDGIPAIHAGGVGWEIVAFNRMIEMNPTEIFGSVYKDSYQKSANEMIVRVVANLNISVGDSAYINKNMSSANFGYITKTSSVDTERVGKFAEAKSGTLKGDLVRITLGGS